LVLNIKVMELIVGKSIIKQIVDGVNKNGIIKTDLVDQLQALRNEFIEAKDPLVTKILRLVCEYLENNGLFNINLMSEVEEGEETPNISEDFNEMKSNLLYFIELITYPTNKYNREELESLKFRLMDLV
jgi:hypothetical protein